MRTLVSYLNRATKKKLCYRIAKIVRVRTGAGRKEQRPFV
jgi:hypothetical protein